MAARYWVGGTASWDGTAGTKWALTSGGAGGQAVPTSADDVFFDAASGAVTCTIATGNTGAKSLNCTGFTGTITGSADISIAGSVTLVAGQTFTHTGRITMTATGTLTTGGKTLFQLYINGAVTLGSALTATNSINVSTSGNLNTSASNFSITALSITVSTSTSTLTLNGSTLTVTGSGGFNATTTSTVNAGTSTIVLSDSNATFTGGIKTYNNVTFTNTNVNDCSINSANTISTLTLAFPATQDISSYTFGADQTISTFVCSGANAVSRVFLKSNVAGTSRTLTVTTWSSIVDVDFRDISMNSSRSGTRLGNCGNNTNITFPAAKTVYWNLLGTQNWSSTGWAAVSGGTPAVNNFPLAQDTAVFNNTNNAGTVVINAPWNIGNFSAPSRTSAMTLDMSSTAQIYGGFSMGSGITTINTSILTFSGRVVGGTQVLSTAGKTITFPIVVDVSGTVLLADAYTSSSASAAAISANRGTFSTGNFNITFSAANSGFTIGATVAKTVTLGSSLLTIAGTGGFNGAITGTTITANTATVSLTSASSKQFSGAGLNYNGLTINQGGAGALTITGSNTFGNITNTYAATGATSILFTAGTANTFSNWNASGQATKLLTIGSVTAASHTLSKSTGTVSADYLSISRSTATGGATWYAGANSTNGGNNTGWIFTGPPSGNFLTFFI